MAIEKLPAFILEFKNVLMIKDPFILGIYCFIKMKFEEGEYKIPIINAMMIEHFKLEKLNIVSALDVLIEELKLLKLSKD